MRKLKWTILVLAAAVLLTGCGSGLPANTVNAAEDLPGKTVGIFGGSIAERSVAAASDGTAAVTYYYSGADIAAALAAGTLDCAVVEDFMADTVLSANKGLRQLREPLVTEAYSFAVAKENVDLTADIDAALAVLTENGTMDAVVRGYLSGDGYSYEAQTSAEEARGTLHMVVAPGREPYQYVGSEGVLVGIEITIAQMVCDQLGCALEILEAEDGRLIPLVQTGIADFAAGCLCATEENLALVDFSVPIVTSCQVILVRKG